MAQYDGSIRINTQLNTKDFDKSFKRLGASIKIFTDPSVVASARTMIEKVAYALGQVTGSLVSIGTTIAQNIIGGIDRYLEQNKEFLKEKLVSIFDIGGDIALLIGEAFESIAYIFEAFGSESGQQLTANIIGIFSNTIMSLLEIGFKFGRDILNCIITPISDNKEELRTAFEGALSVLSEVTGTILDGINETFAELNKVYDEHFKPFFDSIANGLSDTLGKFLDFWNGSVQPMLDKWAKGFDTLWKHHIQPILNNIIGLLGDVADLFTAIWENILKPWIDWIIENILPVILPVIDMIINQLFVFLGVISDIASGAITVIRGIIEFLTGVFTNDWEKVWNGINEIFEGIMQQSYAIIDGVIGYIDGIIEFLKGAFTDGWESAWEGVANIAKNIINSILGFIEKMANGIVQGINTVINALNGLKFDFPDWIPEFGGKSFGLNIPEIPKVSIPRLADGAVIRGGNPFMAVLGDQRFGQTNVEAPLATIRQAVREELKPQRNTGNETFVFQVEGKPFFEITRKEAQQYFKRTGMSPYPV